MNQTEIFLVALPADAAEAARAAVRLAFPGTEPSLVESVAAMSRGTGTESARLLVLTEADAASIASATQFVDAGGAPRWAVVVLGRESSELAETIPPEEWSPPLLARVFRSALTQQALLCENLRLRGDLKTVARRLTHDLRSSLSCIHTSSDLLREIDAASVAAAAGIFKQSSLEISQLIDRVSFVLKASADPSPSMPVAMGDVLTASLGQLDADLAREGATVEQPATWPQVAGVGPWLRVIWANLLTNAIRHGGPAARIQIAWRVDGGECRFSVTDRGRGVEAGRLSGLFQPFDQLHNSQTSGLGLAITQRLVALQEGRCGHEAPAEGGACFYFTLPVHAQPA